MEESLLTLLKSGIKPELILTLAQLMLTFFIVIYIKDKISNYIDYRNIRANKRIAIGTQLQIPTIAGFLNVQVIDIMLHSVLLGDDNVIIDIPIHEFLIMHKVILNHNMGNKNG